MTARHRRERGPGGENSSRRVPRPPRFQSKGLTSSQLPRAKKQYGQHFLEPAWVEKLVRAIDPRSDETFIEIGPGRGALTAPLAARARHVIAYEIDRDLAAALRDSMPLNVSIVQGDFLAQNLEYQQENPKNQNGHQNHNQNENQNFEHLENLEPGTLNAERRTLNPLRITGNLPYNVASPILFKLAEMYARGLAIGDATVMLQREVAERLVSPPGTRDYGVLSVLLQHVAEARLVLKLPPGAFRPPPKVQSAVVQLRFHPPDPPVADPAVFARVVQAVFTRRRKTLGNALLAYGPAIALEKTGIDPTRRPETLSVAEFAALADFYAAKR